MDEAPTDIVDRFRDPATVVEVEHDWCDECDINRLFRTTRKGSDMGVIYTPPARREPTRPDDHASDHRMGTVWETPDGFRWVVEWDEQDHRPMWVLVECQGHATCNAPLHVHGCYADLGRCDAPDEHRTDSAVSDHTEGGGR